MLRHRSRQNQLLPPLPLAHIDPAAAPRPPPLPPPHPFAPPPPPSLRHAPPLGPGSSISFSPPPRRPRPPTGALRELAVCPVLIGFRAGRRHHPPPHHCGYYFRRWCRSQQRWHCCRVFWPHSSRFCS